VVSCFARIGEECLEYEGVENMRLAADQPGDLGEALFFSRGLGRTRGARDQWPLEVRGGAVQWLVTVRGIRWQYRDENVSQLDI
jgi:hypothetical protein